MVNEKSSGPDSETKEIGLLDDLDEVITAQLDQQSSRGNRSRNFTMDYHMPTQEGAKPFVKILVQPQGRALRFRYKCEGRYPGALTGVGSSNETKTYPTIRVENYTGKFVVIISCVTKDQPYRPHPHNIVSKEACKDGVYRNKFDRTNMTAQFTSLGIQCVKKTEVKESLLERKKLVIDPFNTQYDHMNRLGDIDLNAVRLCFQVYIEDVPDSGKFRVPLDPVVSDVIYDRKAMSDLLITKLSHSFAPLQGGLEMIVLCDKISKDDIEIYFYQEDANGQCMWEEKADIVSVHKQVAVCFRSPDCSQHLPADDKLHLAKIHLRRSRVSEIGDGREIYLMSVSASANENNGVKRKRSGQEPNIQMQIELMQARDRGIPTIVTVPRFDASLEPRYNVPSPRSDDSPAGSPRWMMQSPNAAMMVNPQGAQYGVNEMGHILPDQVPRPANVRDAAMVNETAEKLDSLDLGIPTQFTNSDINLNNLNMEELQMAGPAATPVMALNVNGNLETTTNNFSVPNLSESMFESGTSLEQLDLLNSGHLKQFKQEEA